MTADNCKYTAIVLSIMHVLSAGTIAEPVGDFKELTLEIATTVREVLPMEPMPITITLSNNTETPITGHTQINPGIGAVTIYVAKGNQSFEQFHSADWVLLTGIRGEVVLKPGFRKSVSGYLFYAHPANLDKENRGRYLFESPGIYRIKATFDDMNGESRIESNVLTVEAKQPTGEDAAAYRFLKDLQDSQEKDVYYGNFLLADFAGQKVLQKQEEFISKFPDSRYSRCLYYSLGLTYHRSERQQNSVRGIQFLKKAAGYDDFFLAKEALLKLIQTLEKQGKSDQAWRYKKVFARRFPESEEGRDYVEQVYVASVERRRLLWPLMLVAVAAGVFFFGVLPRLRRKPDSG